MQKLFAKHFPGMPVMAMIKRQWLQLEASKYEHKTRWQQHECKELLEHIVSELMKFFQVTSVDELKAMLGWEGDLLDFD